MTGKITYNKGPFIFSSWFQRFGATALGSVDFGAVVLGICGRGYSYCGGAGSLEKPGENMQSPSYLVTCIFQLFTFSEPYKIAPPTGRLHLHYTRVWSRGHFHPNCKKNCMSLSIWDTHFTFWNYSPLSFNLSFYLDLKLSIVLRTSLPRYTSSSSTYSWYWFL